MPEERVIRRDRRVERTWDVRRNFTVVEGINGFLIE